MNDQLADKKIHESIKSNAEKLIFHALSQAFSSLPLCTKISSHNYVAIVFLMPNYMDVSQAFIFSRDHDNNSARHSR